jgi:hypothetical protein
MNTFLVSTFATALALGNGVIDAITALAYMSFMSMQLVEYFAWNASNASNKWVISNRTASIAGLALIVYQPILFTLCIYKEHPRIATALICMYVIFLSLLFGVIKPFVTIDFRSVPAPNGHLAWKWLDFPLAVLIIWVIFLALPAAIQGYWIGFAAIVGLASLSYYLFRTTDTWGSMWCWVANGIALYLIFKVFEKEVCLRLQV